SPPWSSRCLVVLDGRTRYAAALLPGPDELEVAVHVEAVAVGDRVLVDLVLGPRVVVGEDPLVARALEAALRRAEADLSVGGPLLGVEPLGLHVAGARLHVGALAHHVGIVAGADALAGLAVGRVGPVALLAARALAGGLAAAGDVALPRP